MKKVFVSLFFLAIAVVAFMASFAFAAYNFGDFRSETMVGKAWKALEANDTEGVLAYTNKVLELYAEQAQKMQASLKDYPKESKEKVFSYWALNDVATSLFIQGDKH